MLGNYSLKFVSIKLAYLKLFKLVLLRPNTTSHKLCSKSVNSITLIKMEISGTRFICQTQVRFTSRPTCIIRKKLHRRYLVFLNPCRFNLGDFIFLLSFSSSYPFRLFQNFIIDKLDINSTLITTVVSFSM